MLRRATPLLIAFALSMMGCAGTTPHVRAVSTASTVAVSGGSVSGGPITAVPVTTAPAPSSSVATTAPTPSASPASSTPPVGRGATCVTIPLGTPSTAGTAPVTTANPSAEGIGDALFPDLGNPGVDVQHYDVALDYDPVTKDLSGVVTASISFTQSMNAFNLDAAQSVVVSAVTVDAGPSTFTHPDSELRITPATPVQSGSTHEVAVTYTTATKGRNVPGAMGRGWFDTTAGSYNLNEPDGARLWLPVNDHPSDKATWRFVIKVPEGTTAIASGALQSHQSTGGTDTWTWQENRPMATYLAQVVTGHYDIVDTVGPHGLPLISAVLTADRTSTQPYIDAIGDEISFFEQYFGPFPLDRYGIVVSDSPSGLAMEEQERSLFSRLDLDGRFGALQQLFLSHELAHQWFGDAVSPARWQDVWLNESFATYGQWMWQEHLGLATVAESAAAALKRPRLEPPAQPTSAGLFDDDVYEGGALVLQALRRQIGDDRFFALLQRWVAMNNGTSRTTEDFIALAQTVSGQDLQTFFRQWLFSVEVPSALPC